MSMRLCLVDEVDGVCANAGADVVAEYVPKGKDDPHACAHNGHLHVTS